jgi:transcriptional regulator with XRE-family HTH domain
VNEFYKVLRGIRNEFGLSQKDFAAQIGMKPVAYNMVESGKNQPSYALLSTIVKVFKVDANRLFKEVNELELNFQSDTGKYHIKLKIVSEPDYLNQVHEYIRKINYLYQRLIDIRVLLFQELKLKGEFSTQSEADLVANLTKPVSKEVDGENILKYPYENLANDGKTEYLQKLEGCINLFTNTFFECFEQLYNGVRIPVAKELQEKFLLDRNKITDHFKYSHYIKSYK